MIPPDGLETLRQVNHDLRSALLRLRPERTRDSTIRPGELSDLRHQLRRAAECLPRGPREAGAIAALEQESLEYRGNLEKLKALLPSVHTRLLAEKSRLEAARVHLTVARAWAEASQTTL